MWFVLMKSWSKYAKQNKTPKLEFCEETSSATCAIFIFGVLKAGVRAPKRFSLRKKLFCYICKNQGGFDYCYTKVDSLAKFERNRFSNLKRTGPLYRDYVLISPQVLTGFGNVYLKIQIIQVCTLSFGSLFFLLHRLCVKKFRKQTQVSNSFYCSSKTTYTIRHDGRCCYSSLELEALERTNSSRIAWHMSWLSIVIIHLDETASHALSFHKVRQRTDSKPSINRRCCQTNAIRYSVTYYHRAYGDGRIIRNKKTWW